MCALQDNDHGYLAANQFCDQRRQPIVLTLCPPVFDRHVPALGVTGLTQASLKSGKILARRLERCEVEKPDHRHRRLLRAHRKRPSGCRAAEKGDELAPLHVEHGFPRRTVASPARRTRGPAVTSGRNVYPQ
jgi:hypothetical protein